VSGGLIDAMWQDLRFGFRIFTAHRQFSVVAVLVLALGIGATTAVFSVVNAVLLRPLPYHEPGRLVAISSIFETPGRASTSPVVRLADLAEWRAREQAFASMGAFAYTQLPVRVGDRSFSPVTALMDPQFLPTLGNPLAMGTHFSDTGNEMAAIVSHAMWVNAFDADAAAIGRPLVVDGEVYTLRGVLAPDFQFPRSDASYYTRPVELLIPAATFPNFPSTSRQWFAIGRLEPGISLTHAEAELQAIAEGLSRDAGTGDAWSVRLTPLDAATTARSRQPLLLVLAIALVLLLIAATNLMNLFFSRGVARLREMSIRRAMGSTTGRLVRQLLIESLVLAAVGGLGGVALAAVAVDLIAALSPVHLPVTRTITIDGTVLAFATALGVAAALAAGLFPALHASVTSDAAVRNPGLRTSIGRGVARVQQALCVTQIALGMALLAAAGLLAHSLWRLNAVEPGFDSARVIGFDLSVPNDIARPDRIQFYSRALEDVRTIPGVEGAGLISFLPPETRAGVFMGLAIEGVPPPDRGTSPRVVNTLVTSDGYFSTLRMPIVTGRDLAPTDDEDRPPVIVVNEALVRRYFTDGRAIGRRIGTGLDGLKPVREIVGIVRDSHDRGLATAPIPTVYIPFRQFALPYGSIALRSTAAPESIIPVIRERLHRLNASVPVTGFQTLETRLRESLREPRFYTLLAITCAGMAVMFVTFGLYGLVSYSVARRTSELGIRIAVGAQAGAILRMVLLQGLRMALAGVVFGLALSWGLTRLLRGLLFEVSPSDPLTLTMAALVVVLVTVVATLAPARRASRINPVIALRYE
jgi:putative ABC transport system permease protein